MFGVQLKQSLLFNGNHNSNLEDFDVYLDYQKYSFKSEKRDLGGYGILKNKNVILGMDIGLLQKVNFLKITKVDLFRLKQYIKEQK